MIILRLLRKLLAADAIGLILSLIALQALSYGITSSLRTTDTRYFFWVCLAAALMALGLSKRQVRGVHASVLMSVLGILGLWILGARLAVPLVDLGNALLSFLPQLIPAIRFQTPVDTTALAEAWSVVAEASLHLGLRIQTWLAGLSQEVKVDDALVQNLVWVFILWLISAWMGWFSGRRNAVAALLPGILLLAAITAYSGRKVESLWVMVFMLLLLMGLWNYKNHTVQWTRRNVDYSESISYDAGQAVLFLTLIIGALAFVTPSLSWDQIRDFFHERNQNEIAETLGIQQQPVFARDAPVQRPILPREHLLSGGFAQSEKLVMTIQTGELPPIVNPVVTNDVPRYYWRSVTYDTYQGAGWVTSAAPPQKVEPNTPLVPGLLNGYRSLDLEVEMVQPEGKLFWSGILFSADVPLTADWRNKPESNLFVDQTALLQADMFAARSAATKYTAHSYLPLATIEELRAASTDYEETIQRRYLVLPKSVPERVHQLAADITRGKPTAYDKAKAIEGYLRAYPYDLDVPVPPQDQDVTDYFLFDLKRGYCDYYATAMVVLARASGLPARFVSGYASGDYDAPNARYLVREMNAHSWAEVFFPGIGWIEFEPTAAQPEIERAESAGEITNAPADDSSATRLLNRFRLEQAIYWASPFVILLLSLIFYLAMLEPWLYRRLAPAAAVERIYRRLYRLGRPLAGQLTRAETAFEFKRKLVDKIEGLRRSSRLANYLLPAGREVERLTDLYQSTLFRQDHLQTLDVRMALRTWKRLRSRLLLARLINHLSGVVQSSNRRVRQRHPLS